MVNLSLPKSLPGGSGSPPSWFRVGEGGERAQGHKVRVWGVRFRVSGRGFVIISGFGALNGVRGLCMTWTSPNLVCAAPRWFRQSTFLFEVVGRKGASGSIYIIQSMYMIAYTCMIGSICIYDSESWFRQGPRCLRQSTFLVQRLSRGRGLGFRV